MNKDTRDTIKNVVVKTLQACDGPLKLPVPIKRITKSFNNIRLVPYSAHMELYGLTYNEMVDFGGTKDAFTCFDVKTNLYIIFYNDCDYVIMNSNRYRWNIAHELGHIVLGHFERCKDSKMFRKSLISEYRESFEMEADRFASYILVPHIVLACLGVTGHKEIARICRISNSAALYRAEHIQTWKNRNACTDYDFSILTLFSDYIEDAEITPPAKKWLSEHRMCRACHARITEDSLFCPSCGEFLEIYYDSSKKLAYYPVTTQATGVE